MGLNGCLDGAEFSVGKALRMSRLWSLPMHLSRVRMFEEVCIPWVLGFNPCIVGKFGFILAVFTDQEECLFKLFITHVNFVSA